MFIKNCVFSQFTATHPLHVEEQLILARDPSVQSLLLVDHFCTANSSPVLAKERSQNKDSSWKKNTIFNEHPVCATSPIHDSLHEQFQTSIQITGLFFQSGKFALFAKICIHLHTHMQYYLLAIPPPPQGCKWSK